MTTLDKLALGMREHEAGNLQAAEACYREILSAQPNHADALHLLGVIMHQANRNQEAVELIRRAIAINGKWAGYHANLGGVLRAAGKPSEALPSLQRAVELNPADPVGHCNLGNVYSELDRPAEAAACFRRQLRLEPRSAAAFNNLGTALKCQGLLDEAVINYRTALQLDPNNALAHNNLGTALKEQGKLEEAASSYRQAAALKPAFATAHYNLGNVLGQQDRHEEALECYRRALQLQPDYGKAHNNMGNTLRTLGRPEEAIGYLNRALELLPDFAEAHVNLGSALGDLGQIHEAIASYRVALQHRPNMAKARSSCGMLQLFLGDFEQGWRQYEARCQVEGEKYPDFGKPRWDGRRLPDQTVLLYAEQGFGDTFQFIRYAALVKERVQRVVMYTQPPLRQLISTADGIDLLTTELDGLPEFDFQIPLLSLPYVFRTSPETVPAKIPYLSADPDLVQRWRARLESHPGFRIGIAWQGSREYAQDRARSIPLTRFAPLATLPQVRLISLQQGDGVGQLEEARKDFDVLELGPDFDGTAGPFMDTAAVMRNLDLLVTCDTAVGHLAGALGVPVWLALPHVADWRWLQDGEESPWYPATRLFRQPRRGDWDAVFERMRAALEQQLAQSTVINAG